MELRQLSYFSEVATLKSFSKAAARLHVAQSAVSRQVALLEQEIGVRLLERLGRRVEVTRAGMRMLAEAGKVLRAIGSMRSADWSRPDALSGDVALGSPPSLGKVLTAPAVARLRARHPSLYVKADQGPTATLRDQLIAGRIDVAVITDVERVSAVNLQPLARERLFLVGPREMPMPTSRPLKVRDLADYPQIVTPPHNSLRVLLERAFARGRRSPRYVVEATMSELILDLVELRTGYTILAGCAVQERLSRHRVRAVQISDLWYTWLIATRRDVQTDPTIAAVVDELRNVAREAIRAKRWISAEMLD